MPYDPDPFVLPVPRLPGGNVYTEVTWHPRDGEPTGTLGAYVVPSGDHVHLIPGVVPTVVSDLALPGLTEQHADRIAALVDAQLRGAPWAELRCPAGRVEVVLHPRRSR